MRPVSFVCCFSLIFGVLCLVARVPLLRFTFRCLLDFLSYVSAPACVSCRLLGIIVCMVLSPWFNFIYTLLFRLLRLDFVNSIRGLGILLTFFVET